MEIPVNILGFAGSLRNGSYNQSILRAAVELAPKDAKIEVFSIDGFPPFNQDLEDRMPEKIRKFKAKIESADAILIATPEYNFSIPGVLKNAIDWASRPHGDNSFEDKPVAIMGASPGMIGTARAQYHLRQCCVFLDMHPVNSPEVFVASADDKINESGRLTDEKTRQIIKDLIYSLVVWTRRLNTPQTV